MTQVQSMTIGETLKGIDVLAQAKTGTGKTLGFLIPVLQNILAAEPDLANGRSRSRASASDVLAVIISPTRELAEQIAMEARRITERMGIIVQTAVGGTEKRRSLQQMQRQGCHLLVGTPGRLKDILSDRSSGVAAPNLNTFVLDEADRLLDQGFWPEIQAIEGLLPDKTTTPRQTLMFSATVPREVISMVQQTMKRDYRFVRTVQEGEEQTHAKVPQRLVNAGNFENLLPALLELCKREIHAADGSGEPFKAIVYFGATAHVSLAASTFANLRGSRGKDMFAPHPLQPAKLIEMHARLSQLQRTRASEAFRAAKSAIMFSSDVTARGMDFPNVTHVIQVGLPSGRDAYIHRLGRTARGNKTGEGWLLATELEMRELRQRLRGMKLIPDTSLQSAGVDMSQAAELPSSVAETLTEISNATRSVGAGDKAKAYLASLGIYSFLPAQGLVDALNRLSQFGWGWDTPPGVPPGLAKRLGLSRVVGLNISADRERSGEPPEGRGARGGYGRSDGGGRDGGFRGRGGGRDRGFGGDRDADQQYSSREGGFRGRRGGGRGFGRDPEGAGDRFAPRERESKFL
ncbi:MAG: hypothetical protein M1832_001030 [Thelocarpon impressellum]|nr:MAG: hypothetical protein M1832_001030 [Thelocarpon impressellum]